MHRQKISMRAMVTPPPPHPCATAALHNPHPLVKRRFFTPFLPPHTHDCLAVGPIAVAVR